MKSTVLSGFEFQSFFELTIGVRKKKLPTPKLDDHCKTRKNSENLFFFRGASNLFKIIHFEMD